MAKPDYRGTGFWALLTATILIAGSAFWFLSRPRDRGSTAEAPPGQNILVTGVAGTTVDEQLLKPISWADVVPTAEGIGADKVLRDQVVALTGTLNHPPALYLRALLLIAAQDAVSALDTFLLIPPESIPATHLYAPYRLHNELRPSQTNPFQAAARTAVAENRLPPLIQARVLASEGRLPETLQAYLKTDPAEWTDVDLRALRGLRMHAAFAHDTAVMLQAVLRGGRLPINLRTQVVEIVKAPRDGATLDDLKQQLLLQMDGNPELRRAAVTGAVEQLIVRQQFVGRKYRELLDQQGQRDPMDLPDETVLMLALSAARLQDAPAFERWSQELNRRYRTPEITAWLSELRPTPPSRAP